MTTFTLTVSATPDGSTFMGHVKGTGIEVRSSTPFLAAARALVECGHPADAMLVMRWRGADHDALRGEIGPASELEVGSHGFKKRGNSPAHAN